MSDIQLQPPDLCLHVLILTALYEPDLYDNVVMLRDKFMCLSRSAYRCPLCMHSAFNMKEFWEERDKEIAQTPMPSEYQDTTVKVRAPSFTSIHLADILSKWAYKWGALQTQAEVNVWLWVCKMCSVVKSWRFSSGVAISTLVILLWSSEWLFQLTACGCSSLGCFLGHL